MESSRCFKVVFALCLTLAVVVESRVIEVKPSPAKSVVVDTVTSGDDKLTVIPLEVTSTKTVKMEPVHKDVVQLKIEGKTTDAQSETEHETKAEQSNVEGKLAVEEQNPHKLPADFVPTLVARSGFRISACAVGYVRRGNFCRPPNS